jgi:Flp pilus assembly protein TadB
MSLGASARDRRFVTPPWWCRPTTRPFERRKCSACRSSVGRRCAEAAERATDGGPHLRLALGVISTASRLGGPSAASIDRTAVALRQRAADLDERSAQAAQARLSTHVMTAVPLLMLAVLLATDADVRSAATSTIGAGCIGVGLALNLLGWWWMHRIVGARA